MRIQLVAMLVLIGCQADPGEGDPTDGVLAGDLAATVTLDPLKEIFDQVDGDRIIQLMRDLSGVDLVNLGGTMTRIDERFSSDGRKRFRQYFTQYMANLGLEVNQFHYQAARHPRGGDNVEAILRGPSPDSFIVIVHYDSIGPRGRETMNPGADDDMSGMAILLETARLFVANRDRLTYTVRFVASDEEELGGLAGARDYAAHIKALSQSEGFALVAAVDDEQSGWNCSADKRCGDQSFPAFDIFSCGSGAGRSFDFDALGDQFESVVAAYSPLHVTRGCLGQNSDHFAMWEIGVPAVVYSEHNPFANPHFDRSGGDTFDKIDTAYLISIARPAIAFQAGLAGLKPRSPTGGTTQAR
jgi:hypothetical protein